MFNLSRRPALTRAGGGVAVLMMVALAAYGVGLAHSPSAGASAAAPPPVSSPTVSVAPNPTSYASVVDAVAPAVVTVRVEKRASVVTTQFPDDDFFRFFGRQFELPRQQRTPRQAGLGSGVVTTSDGYILTNNHVIDGADQVRVELTDKRSFDAKVVGADPASDLAVLKINAHGLPTATIGDSSRMRVGDLVLAIGNPLGVGQTVTMGIISAKGRATGVGDGSYEDFLQTDAPINQGNSGGALVNLNGEVIGINSQILTPTGGNIGLGFAIPSNMAREVMEQLKSTGTVRRGKLGVLVQSITPDIAASLKLPDATGALVSSVEAGSPASRAGLEEGDLIASLNGQKVVDSNSLRNRVAAIKPGTEVTLDVIRKGQTKTLHATLAEMESTRARNSTGEGESGSGFGPSGMSVEPLTPNEARELGLSGRRDGLVIRDVDPDGVAASAGLRPGDVITRVNGQPVKTVGELKAALNASTDRPALLLVTRDNENLFVALPHPRS